jgi:WD40 repeat protein
MSATAFPPLSPSEPPRVFGAPTLHTDGDLLAVAVASDGTLWSVEEPGELRGWNLATRRLISSRPLESLGTLWTFNWAARLLASASDEVAVWEVSSGVQLAQWSTPTWITALAFQPGAAVLATGHDDGLVSVWDWAGESAQLEIQAHTRAVSAVAFSFDGTKLATAGEDKKIHVWNLQTGEKLGTLEGHKDRISGLAWHPDARRLFSSGWDTTVRVWDVNRFEPIILLNSHATQVHTLAMSGDGKLLATADSDNAVHIWDTDLNETITVLRQPGGEVRCLAFTPNDGRGNLPAPLLACGGADRVIHLWDSRQGPASAGSDELLVCRTVVAVSPDGKRLLSLGAGTDLRCWEVESGKPAVALDQSPLLRTMAQSPDGNWIAASRISSPADRSTLALYQAQTGTRQAVCEGQTGPITALAFRADGKVLASGSVRSSDVWLWDVPSGEASLLIPDIVQPCSVEAMAFHPDGKRLAVAGIDWMATGGEDGHIALWNLDEGRLDHSLPGGATAVAFSPDGKRLAAAGLDRKVRVWDLATNGVALTLAGHIDTITCLAFSPDGTHFATGSDDRTIRLWEADTGEQAGAWELDNAIKSLAFAPDGAFLFTGNGNTSCYQIEVAALLDDEI